MVRLVYLWLTFVTVNLTVQITVTNNLTTAVSRLYPLIILNDKLGCSLLDSFLCNDQSCIDRVKMCNLHNDCPDGEDEIGCEEEVTCGPNQLRCHKERVYG